MANTKTATAYKFAEDRYFNGTALVMTNPMSGEWLLPPDCILQAPELKEGFFYKLTKENTWQAEKIPTSCEECLGLAVKHTDNTMHGNTLRILMNALVEADKDNYEISRDEELTITVVKKEKKEETLEEVKAARLEELSQRCHAFDNQLVNGEMIIRSSLGFKANADLRSQSNLNGLIGVGVEPVSYMDADNQPHSLTIADLNTLLTELALNGQNLYKQKWLYANRINGCKSIDDVKAIEFTFEMMNFSNE